MADPSSTLRQNIGDLISAHQSYLNNQYDTYVQQRDAYQQYIDTHTRAEAIANDEAQKHQADQGWWQGALGGAATGASAGAAAGPWGALIGGVAGAGLGIAAGLSNKSAVDKQVAADEARVRTEPLGAVTSQQFGGNGLMDPKTWAAAQGLSGAIGAGIRSARSQPSTSTNPNAWQNTGTQSTAPGGTQGGPVAQMSTGPVPDFQNAQGTNFGPGFAGGANAQGTDAGPGNPSTTPANDLVDAMQRRRGYGKYQQQTPPNGGLR